MVKGKKVFDVADPGQASPDASSRPLIVGHSANLEDPMMAKPGAPSLDKKIAVNISDPPASGDPPAEAVPVAALSSANRIKISPLSDQQPAGQAAPNEAEKDEEANTEVESPPVSDTAVVNAVVSQADSAKAKKDQTSEEEVAKHQRIEQAIVDKQYFVNISESRQARSFNRILILVLVLLLLALIAFNFALDADLLDVDIQPITNLL